MDPDVFFSDEEFARIARDLGFQQFYGPEGFETIQARFNYRLYLGGRSEDQLLADFTQQTRRNIRLAIRHGVEVRVCGKEQLGEFCRLMETTGERDGFAIRPRGYFERFLDALGDKARLYLAFYEGRAIGGAITTNVGGKTCYVYGASDNECRNVMPNYLVQWEMIRWAVETGCTVYDFQGVSGNLEPENNHLYGLYRFKKGFCGQLDELTGEWNYTYRPLSSRMVDHAISLNEKLRKIKRLVKK
jgi:lipid II:glycine glycyltransferase (peptidoglycan interpeptide bridge formation enzyme)